MSGVNDYRSNPHPETSFYVYDDLRAWQKGMDSHIYYYDTLDEAIRKFKEMPDDMTTALGISFRETQEIDMVQKNRGEAFLTWDYLHVDFVKEVPNHELYLNKAIKELNLRWKSEYALFGSNLKGVLIPIHEGPIDESYLRHKRSVPKNKKYPVSAISLFFNEGVGWQSYEEVVKSAEIIYGNTAEYRKPRISKVNVNYAHTSPDTGNVHYGSADLNVASYRLLLEQSHEKITDKIADADSRVQNNVTKTLPVGQKYSR